LPRLKLVLAKARDEKPARDGRLFFAVMGDVLVALLAGVYPVRESLLISNGVYFLRVRD